MDKVGTVVEMLARAVAEAPDREALVCEDERLTYAEYARCVAGFAAELKALGAAGERVAILMGNGIDCCIAMFAALAANAQAVPLNPLYTERELRPIIQDAAPKVIVCDGSAAPLAHRVAEGAEMIAVGEGKRLTAWRGEKALSLKGAFPAPESLAYLQYTGGTTGRSKGVNLTHGAVAVNIDQSDRLLPTRWNSERLLAVMPLFHVYAQAMCFHRMPWCAGTLVIVPKFDVKTVLETLVRERITIFAGGPTLFRAMLSSDDFARTEFPHLRFTISGSAALPAELLQRFVGITGKPVVEGYGQTEAGPVVSFNPLSGPQKPASVGLPIPGTEVEIVDLENGTRSLPTGEKGEIRVRGPQIMSGYRNLPDESAQTLREGWLYTSDIGTFDADGYLYICDRKKEMILVSGFNVFPREVEEVLYMHQAVKEAAVIGVPHEYRGEAVKAYVVLHQDLSRPAEELTAHCRANLAAYKVPTFFEFIDELPKTAVNKIDKKQLRAAQ